MTTVDTSRFLHKLGNSTYNHLYYNRTTDIADLPILSQTIIYFAVAILTGVSLVPILGFLYGCIRKDRILREIEERRRRSLAELTANNEARDSTFQKEIDSIPEEQKKEFLCNLMVACTWVSEMKQSHDVDCSNRDIFMPSQECNSKIILPERNLKKKSKALMTNKVESSDFCAICISNFEDGDSVVQSSIKSTHMEDGNKTHDNESNPCKHRFHRDCMIEWLLICKEPICPYCRQDYLDYEKNIEGTEMINDNNSEETRSVSDTPSTPSEDTMILPSTTLLSHDIENARAEGSTE